MLTGQQEQETITLCQNLIRAKGYSGEEAGTAQVLQAYFNTQGFDEITVDVYGNSVGVIHGNRPGPCIVFDGHMDTVPVNEADWSRPPFAAEVTDGRIYGRGTSDMKGALAAMCCAASFFARKTGRDFPGTVVVAGVVQEELFEGVAARAVSKAYKPDYVIIGEASALNVKIGQRGRAEIVVETFGTTAHSAHPEKGNNAVYSMCKVVEAIGRLPVTHHPKLNDGILVLTDIKSDPYPGSSCVPAYCKATYDRRTLVGETGESVLAPIQACLEALMQADPTVQAKASYAKGTGLCYTGTQVDAEKFYPAWLYGEQEPFVKACLDELHAQGFTPEVTVYDFCTNGSHYAGEAGIPTIGLGPSQEDLAHTVDEYIEIDQLTKAVECYMAIMKALLKTA